MYKRQGGTGIFADFSRININMYQNLVMGDQVGLVHGTVRHTGTYHNAVSYTHLSLAETILVIKANQLRKEGKTLEENAAYLEEYKKHLHVQFTVDDLFHLKRGGRISGAVAAVGTALNLKPFLYVGREGTCLLYTSCLDRQKCVVRHIQPDILCPEAASAGSAQLLFHVLTA